MESATVGTNLHRAPPPQKKTSTFYFVDLRQKSFDFNDFWQVKAGENLT